MQGPSRASPDARAAGGVGQSQGRGRAGARMSHPNTQEGQEAMEQLEAAGPGFAPVTVATSRRGAGPSPRATAGARLWGPAVPRQSGQHIGEDGKGTSTRGDCEIACGRALLPA